MNRTARVFVYMAVCAVVVGGVAFTLPSFFIKSLHSGQNISDSSSLEQFPVTVDPKRKIIVENDQVNALFERTHSPLSAAVGNTRNVIGDLVAWLALTIAATPWYQNLAAANTRLVAISPGMRKEQVVNIFASALDWNSEERRAFLTRGPYASLPLPEGSFAPGMYALDLSMTPGIAQAMVNDRFSAEVLSRYGTTTAAMVPLDQALTIASLIEREAGGPVDMRIISGIIWNRLFINMPLQIDATLQYVKANSAAAVAWWPRVVPADRFRASPYNTYLHTGLPPAPIANPSVASILAALNPKNTTCLFYFHDAAKQFHCSDTYADHVALLKKYYGRGK